MVIKDRFSRGLVSGLCGGVAMALINNIFYFLGLSTVLFRDWSGILIYGGRGNSLGEMVLAQGAHLFFAGVVGVIFIYLISLIKINLLYIKATVWSLTVWFGSFSIAVLFELTQIIPVEGKSVFLNLIAAIIYGLVLAWSIIHLTPDEEKVYS